MAEHYHIAVLPTRTGKARDKAKVENGVLQAQRRILAVIRNRTFFSITELNTAIYEETEKLNRRRTQAPSVRAVYHRVMEKGEGPYRLPCGGREDLL